ncbi:MAG: protoporphyrinogen oxidase [Burkholderiaceae bacterium]|jgi:oxygen-dependent protoporphyrinogen oxidase|nr:protoporphyrinogen oxidase [Burkholderiaceae bacterium]
MDSDVLVIGAGLSGLVAAFRARKAGLSVTVLEARARPGGVIGSERRGGVLLERGPNSGLDTTPLINALLTDLGIADQRVDGSRESSRRYVVRGGRLVALPTSPGAFLGTPLFSTRAKLRLFAEPFIRKSPADAEESIAQFVRRRLGSEFLDYAIEPFVAGIYAGDPEQLSVPAAFPRLHALEQRYGSLIKGAIMGARERKKSADKAKNTAASFSFREGMQTLTDALGRAVGGIECDVRVGTIQPGADGMFTVTGERAGTSLVRRARAVIVATPAYAAADLVRAVAPEAAAALAAIPYPPVTVVGSAYRRTDIAHPLDGFGFLAPAKERPAVLGSLFSSTMFEGRAPADTVVLTTFVGGRRNPELATAGDENLASAVHGELVRLVGARAQPLWREITRWARAIPQYTMGHLGRIAAVEQAERVVPGLYFCANYRGGVSIGDCVKAGHAIAERVATRLAGA